MQALWRKTVFLVWENPPLWLPVFVAAVVSFFIELARVSVSRAITIALINHQAHSVLGTTPEYSEVAEHSSEILLLVGPFESASYLLTAFLYAAALLAIKQLLSDGDPKKDPIFASLFGTRQRIRIAALLAVKLCAMVLVVGIAEVYVSGSFSSHQLGLQGAWAYTLVFAVVGVPVLAFWAAPVVSRALVGKNRILPGERIRFARYAILLGLLASTLLGYLCGTAVASLSGISNPDHWLMRLLTGLAASLISAAPYIPLFIFLALATNESSPVFEPELLPVQ